RSDALRGGAPRRVHQDQELDQVVICGRTGRLDDEHILAADVLVDLHERLTVRKTCDRRLPERLADRSANFLGERTVGIAGEYLEPRLGHEWRAMLEAGPS